MNDFPENDRYTPITLQMIADRCGVTKMTVSRALRDSINIRPVTRERILSVAAELGYDPAVHEAARRMALRKYGTHLKTRTIALLFPELYQMTRYYARIYQGILESAEEAGYSLVTKLIHEQDTCPGTPLPPAFARGDIDGVICSPGADMMAYVRKLKQHKSLAHCSYVKMVTFDEADDDVFVGADSCLGSRLAAEHLLSLGHQNILHTVQPEQLSQHIARYNEVAAVLTEHGLDVATHLFRFINPQSWFEPRSLASNERDYTQYPAAGEPEAEFVQYLRANPQISAIMCENDSTAIQIWRTLRHAGYNIPDDISIVGFDNTDPFLDSYGINLLTTVDVPLVEVGKLATRTLLKLIQGEKPQSRVELPPTLTIRHSTAAPSSAS